MFYAIPLLQKKLHLIGIIF